MTRSKNSKQQQAPQQKKDAPANTAEENQDIPSSTERDEAPIESQSQNESISETWKEISEGNEEEKEVDQPEAQHEPVNNEQQTAEPVANNTSYTQKLDHVLEEIGNGDKPWFLSSTEIYKTTKDVVATIPKGKDMFDQSLRTLSTVTKKINESTKLNVAFEIEQSYDLINQLDALLAENLVVVDDGLDDLRGKFAGNLRNLITAVVQHKNWAESYAVETKQAAKDKVITRYEQALNMLKSIAGYVESKFPVAYTQASTLVYSACLQAEQISASISNRTTAIKDVAHNTYTASVDKTKESIKSAQHKVDSLAMTLVYFGLRVAQPYVHHAMELTVPYVNQAICISTPVVKPYVVPVVQKAMNVNESLKDNHFIGQYVSKANDVANQLLHETKAYCIPSTVEIGMF